jgi:MFS family permease
MQRSQINFLFLNIGHFLDHFFVLVFATVAALRLTTEWGLSYAELIPYATPGFIAFGLFAIPAGWLADKWSRPAMMVVFFIGIGISGSLAGMANNPTQMALALTLVGMFAAIYHPVGLSMVVEGRTNTGIPLAVNGIFGNMGAAAAALLTGFLIDAVSWRSAYFVPGTISILIGCAFLIFLRQGGKPTEQERSDSAPSSLPPIPRKMLLCIFGPVLFTTAIGGLIFQSTTFSLPKIFDGRLTDIAGTATAIGWYVFLVFSVAAFAQLIVGYLVDRYSLRAVFAVVALSQALLFAVMTHLSGLVSLLVAMAFMLVVFGQIPINDVLIGRIARSEWRSRAYALRYIVSFSVSASAVPLIAWIHGTSGFGTLFKILAVAAFVIFVAVLFLPNRKALDLLRSETHATAAD